MVAIDTSDFRNGLCFRYDDQVYMVMWFQHHKPGKGGAVMRTKMKNVRTGAIIERTFKAGERFESVDLERRPKQYTYKSGDQYVFMDQESFEEISVPADQLGDAVKYLKEGMEVEGMYLGGEFFGIDLPFNVELTVVSTVPGVRGDSVSNVTKPATVETGAEIQVPLFINEGDVIKVDTRTGEYLERVNQKR